MESVSQVLDEVGINEEYHDLIAHYLTVLRTRHEDTFNHAIRVGLLASKMAEHADIPEVTPKMMMWAGLLHDIGKALIPPELLTKVAEFSEDDYEVMEGHVIYGWMMLQKVFDFTAHVIVRHHQFGKRSYPKTLPPLPHYLEAKRDVIEAAARLLALADYYDALTTRKNDKHRGDDSEMRDIYLRDNSDHAPLIYRLEAVGVLSF
jgi:putative nucleotidyltransferase with HDIG domain